ncbi:sigma-70 family RNA polymerase sigma factor [Streptomyces varsoviensis]|uniref:RNA polymerase sigma factor n=1 Tax=Streptomyces varsoviensis TaxID=67373 RepID=A0ABR5J6Q3_9ACTN|nr:sigma-70 family RNA polymerase sigma factor [Streptomyces varsoviensis]KOG89019.1 RNA polymerase sigma factor [Streptomyces varsoviensis]
MNILKELSPLLAAEARAEAHAAGIEAADLEQGVWLRLLERTRRTGPPAEPAAWLRTAVRTEARDARRRARREVPYDQAGGPSPGGAYAGPYAGPYTGAESEVESEVLAAEERRALRAAVRRLPGRCPRLLGALLSKTDPTYREIAGELGISQGSLGPVRSRCLGCLRRMLMAEIAAPDPWGRER